MVTDIRIVAWCIRLVHSAGTVAMDRCAVLLKYYTSFEENRPSELQLSDVRNALHVVRTVPAARGVALEVLQKILVRLHCGVTAEVHELDSGESDRVSHSKKRKLDDSNVTPTEHLPAQDRNIIVSEVRSTMRKLLSMRSSVTTTESMMMWNCQALVEIALKSEAKPSSDVVDLFIGLTKEIVSTITDGATVWGKLFQKVLSGTRNIAHDVNVHAKISWVFETLCTIAPKALVPLHYASIAHSIVFDDLVRNISWTDPMSLEDSLKILFDNYADSATHTNPFSHGGGTSLPERFIVSYLIRLLVQCPRELSGCVSKILSSTTVDAIINLCTCDIDKSYSLVLGSQMILDAEGVCKQPWGLTLTQLTPLAMDIVEALLFMADNTGLFNTNISDTASINSVYHDAVNSIVESVTTFLKLGIHDTANNNYDSCITFLRQLFPLFLSYTSGSKKYFNNTSVCCLCTLSCVASGHAKAAELLSRIFYDKSSSTIFLCFDKALFENGMDIFPALFNQMFSVGSTFIKSPQIDTLLTILSIVSESEETWLTQLRAKRALSTHLDTLLTLSKPKDLKLALVCVRICSRMLQNGDDTFTSATGIHSIAIKLVSLLAAMLNDLRSSLSEEFLVTQVVTELSASLSLLASIAPPATKAALPSLILFILTDFVNIPVVSSSQTYLYEANCRNVQATGGHKGTIGKGLHKATKASALQPYTNCQFIIVHELLPSLMKDMTAQECFMRNLALTMKAQTAMPTFEEYIECLPRQPTFPRDYVVMNKLEHCQLLWDVLLHISQYTSFRNYFSEVVITILANLIGSWSTVHNSKGNIKVNFRRDNSSISISADHSQHFTNSLMDKTCVIIDIIMKSCSVPIGHISSIVPLADVTEVIRLLMSLFSSLSPSTSKLANATEANCSDKHLSQVFHSVGLNYMHILGPTYHHLFTTPEDNGP